MKHILFDLEGCDADLLDDYRFVRNTLFHAAILSNSRILKIDFHQFTPQGVTGFALLADSHISIHTWILRIMLQSVTFLLVMKSALHKKR